MHLALSWWTVGAVGLGIIVSGFISFALWPRERWTDERIGAGLHELLSVHEECDSSDVFFRVENGTIILFGTVRTEREKYQVESIARSVACGAVINHLEISHETSPEISHAPHRLKGTAA